MQPNGAICITTVLLLLPTIQCQQTQLFGFILMTEKRLNKHSRSLLAAALLHERNLWRRRLPQAPYVLKVGRARHLTNSTGKKVRLSMFRSGIRNENISLNEEVPCSFPFHDLAVCIGSQYWQLLWALAAGSFVFAEFGKIGQPHSSTPVSLMLFADFEIFEKAQMRGPNRKKACWQTLIPGVNNFW